MRRRRFETSTNAARLDYAEELDRPFDALERMRTAILHHKEAGNQTMSLGGYQDRAGIGGRLYPCRDVRRIAEDRRFLALAGIYDDRARIDSDSGR